MEEKLQVAIEEIEGWLRALRADYHHSFGWMEDEMEEVLKKLKEAA